MNLNPCGLYDPYDYIMYIAFTHLNIGCTFIFFQSYSRPSVWPVFIITVRHAPCAPPNKRFVLIVTIVTVCSVIIFNFLVRIIYYYLTAVYTYNI